MLRNSFLCCARGPGMPLLNPGKPVLSDLMVPERMALEATKAPEVPLSPAVSLEPK